MDCIVTVFIWTHRHADTMLHALTGVQISCRYLVDLYDFAVPFSGLVFFSLYILMTHLATYSIRNTSQEFIRVKNNLLLTKRVYNFACRKNVSNESCRY